MGYASARLRNCHQPRPRVVGSMDGAYVVLSPTVQGLRDLGVREWSSAPRLCLTRRDLMFFRGTTQLAWKDRRRGGKVEVTFRAGTSDQNRIGSVVPRTRVVTAVGVDRDVRSKEALEILLDLLDRQGGFGQAHSNPAFYARFPTLEARRAARDKFAKTCLNFGEDAHFARDCPEPFINVSTQINPDVESSNATETEDNW